MLFVHFELPFRLKGTEQIHTERFFKFLSNIYSILYDYNFWEENKHLCLSLHKLKFCTPVHYLFEQRGFRVFNVSSESMQKNNREKSFWKKTWE